MDVDREQLQKLREQIGRKAHLTSMLDNLYVQEKEQKEKVEELRQEKEDEQKDVDRLEDRGLTALFYSLIFLLLSQFFNLFLLPCILIF